MAWLPYALILVVLAVVVGTGYWTWQTYEYSRAFRLLKAGQYAEVIPHTERLIAFGTDPMRARVIQIRARIELDPIGSLDELNTLLADGGASEHPEVGLAFLQMRVDSDNLEGVDQVLEDLQSSQAANPEFLLLQAKIQEKRGQVLETYQSLQQLLSVDPDNAQAQLMYGLILLKQNNRAADIQAKVNLRKAAADRGKVGLDALIAMASGQGIPLFANDREWLMLRLRENRKGTPTSRLLADTQQLFLEPDNRSTIIATAVRREGGKDPQLVARWLMANGAYPELLQFLQSPASQQLEDGDRWNAELMANLRSKNMDAASRMLNEPGQQMSGAQRATLLAFISIGQEGEDSKEPSPLWVAAFEQAQAEEAIQQLLTLGQIALRKGWIDQATACFKESIRVAKTPRQELAVIPYYLAMLTLEGKSADALALVRRSLELRPEDVGMLNNQYYLEALLDDETDPDPERIVPLVEKAPDSVIRSTYAFLLWKAGEMDKAQEQFALLRKEHLNVASCRLGGALIAVDLKKYAEAAELMEKLDPKELMPEEVALYQKTLAALESHKINN